MDKIYYGFNITKIINKNYDAKINFYIMIFKCNSGSNSYKTCLEKIKKILKENFEKQIFISIYLYSEIKSSNILVDIVKLSKNNNISRINIVCQYGYYCCYYTSIYELTQSQLFYNSYKSTKESQIDFCYTEKIIEMDKIIKSHIYNKYYDKDILLRDTINNVPFPGLINDKCIIKYPIEIGYKLNINKTYMVTLNNINFNINENLIYGIEILLSFEKVNKARNNILLLNIKNINTKIVILTYILKTEVVNYNRNRDPKYRNVDFLCLSDDQLKTTILLNKIIKNKQINKIYLQFACSDEIMNEEQKQFDINYYIPKLLIPLIHNSFNLKYDYLDKLTFANIKIIDNQNILTFLKYYKYINNRKNYEKYNKNNLIKLLFILKYFNISNELIFIMLKYY